MEHGIYIFDNGEDFINTISEMENQYKPPIYLTKHLDCCNAVRKEIDFLKQCNINSFSSFYTSQVVIIALTDYTNCIINVKYTFKGTGYLFRKFRGYFKRNFENIYL